MNLKELCNWHAAQGTALKDAAESYRRRQLSHPDAGLLAHNADERAKFHQQAAAVLTDVLARDAANSAVVTARRA